MRHGVRGRKLGRTYSHRKALFRNQLASMLLHERIRTTVTKAKELRPLVEKLVTLAKRDGKPSDRLHAIRLAAARVVHPVAVKRLFEQVAPRFKERPGGYTRILKLGKLRKGDNAELAYLEFVDYAFEPTEKKKGPKKGEKAEEKGKGPETAEPEPEEKAAKKPAPKKGKPGEGDEAKGTKRTPAKRAEAPGDAKKAAPKKKAAKGSSSK